MRKTSLPENYTRTGVRKLLKMELGLCEGPKLSITEGREEQGDCVMQLFGSEVSGMQQERKSGICNQWGNMWSRFEDENMAAGSKGESEKENMRCEVLIGRTKSRLSENI